MIGCLRAVAMCVAVRLDKTYMAYTWQKWNVWDRELILVLKALCMVQICTHTFLPDLLCILCDWAQ